MKKIAIQGIKGAFHQAAAEFYYNETLKIVECLTFDQLFEAVESQKADDAIMAIENTIGGSILPNYRLLRNSNLRICGEIFLQLNQNLLANKHVDIHDITEVYSHSMAILQTKDFFNQFPNIKLINADDTAGSAKFISEKKIMQAGAIASKLAAKIYNLEILASNIETVKQNQTRFLILRQKYNAFDRQKDFNKASISFVLSHIKGSLSQVLSIFSFYDINLTKIQSMPIIGREWEYEFFADLTFISSERYRQALNAAIPLTIELSVLGEYAEGQLFRESEINNNSF